MTGKQPRVEFALIVGAARSGTTLTRLLTDAHPEMVCPPEAGLAALMAHMAGVWQTVDSKPDEIILDSGLTNRTQVPADPAPMPPGRVGPDTSMNGLDATSKAPVPLDSAASAWIRTAVDAVKALQCDPLGKHLYVDKSLDSVHYLDLVQKIYPGIRVIFVYRHIMDTIASGIEASPWGFHAYGYAPFVAAHPGNTVAALASYWLNHVSQALAWEEKHHSQCLRVRYEDLVTNPMGTVLEMQRFLGVREDLSVLETAFDRRLAPGPGDYKVDFTDRVHAGSIGNGKRVPVSMLAPGLLTAVNTKLTALGYPELDAGWNTEERQFDNPKNEFWAQRLLELMTTIQVATSVETTVESFALIAEDRRQLRWVIDLNKGSVTQGDGDVDAVLTGTAEDLSLMICGEVNLGLLLRSGRIRHVVAGSNEQRAGQTNEGFAEVRRIASLLKIGAARNWAPTGRA